MTANDTTEQARKAAGNTTPPPAVCRFYYLGMKQLMAGGGVALVGMVLVPLLSGLFG